MIGAFAVLYCNEASQNAWDSPSWVKVPNVRDLTGNSVFEPINVSVRGRKAPKTAAPYRGIHRVTLDWEMVWNPDDDQIWTKIHKLHLGGLKHLDLWAADREFGAGIIARGWRAEWDILQFGDPQPLNGLLTATFQATPRALWEFTGSVTTESPNGPIWFEHST